MVIPVRIYIMWIGAVGCGALLLAVLWPREAETSGERHAIREGRTIITYWDRHQGHEHKARLALFDEFNKSQKEVFIRAVPIGYNALLEKTLTATAGGSPPDVMSFDSGMLSQLAIQGLFLPLEDFMAQYPALRQEAFFPHIWEMVSFEGHVWGIPTTSDSYCLIWNKSSFRRAGLDPERPPKNIEELNEYAAKLTVRGASGEIDQMGFLPWLPWDQSFMWGAMYGGLWYDGKTGRARASEDPAIVASLAWQQSYTCDPRAATQLAYAMDPERIAAFSKSMGDYMSANNPFYSGKVAMIAEGEWQVTFIPKYAPGLDWGVAPIPQPEGVPPVAYGSTCISDAIPATARHPEAAKKFLAWFYNPRPDGRPSPASDYNYAIHNVPCRRDEALQERFVSNAKFKVFVDQLFDRPVVPLPATACTQFLSDQIERQRERVTFRKATPEEAAQAIDDIVNRELARIQTLADRRNGS